jgi:nucleotide-binding universal stress UspA family protein
MFVHPQQGVRMYKHILLPTDGSKLAAKAVRQGLALARAIKAKVTVINVTPGFKLVIDEGFVLPNAGALKKRVDEQTARHAATIVGAVATAARTAKIKCDTTIVSSDRPYDAIIRYAKKAKCDLIVMASHGRKGLNSILLGSETAKVLTHSKIPVLVVR